MSAAAAATAVAVTEAKLCAAGPVAVSHAGPPLPAAPPSHQPRVQVLHELERLDARPLSEEEVAAATQAVLAVLKYSGARDEPTVSAWCEQLGRQFPIVYRLDWLVCDHSGYTNEQLVILAVANLYFGIIPPVSVQRERRQARSS